MKEAREYWGQEQSSSVFDVVQAITHGTKQLTEGKRVAWDARDKLETSVLDIANQIMLNGEHGFVTTVGHVQSMLSEVDPDVEFAGSIAQTQRGDRQVVTVTR